MVVDSSQILAGVATVATLALQLRQCLQPKAPDSQELMELGAVNNRVRDHPVQASTLVVPTMPETSSSSWKLPTDVSILSRMSQAIEPTLARRDRVSMGSCPQRQCEPSNSASQITGVEFALEEADLTEMALPTEMPTECTEETRPIPSMDAENEEGPIALDVCNLSRKRRPYAAQLVSFEVSFSQWLEHCNCSRLESSTHNSLMCFYLQQQEQQRYLMCGN
jgi:hypothetical protein